MAFEPRSVAKTRFQAGNVVKVPPHSSLRTPNNTFSYLYHLAQHEGVKMLWKGSSMRLLRLSVSLVALRSQITFAQDPLCILDCWLLCTDEWWYTVLYLRESDGSAFRSCLKQLHVSLLVVT